MPPINNKETAIRFFKENFENKLNQFIEHHPSEDIVDLGKMAESIIRKLVSNVLGEIDKITFTDLLKEAPIISNFDIVIYGYKNRFNLHDKGLVLTSYQLFGIMEIHPIYENFIVDEIYEKFRISEKIELLKNKDFEIKGIICLIDESKTDKLDIKQPESILILSKLIDGKVVLNTDYVLAFVNYLLFLTKLKNEYLFSLS